MKTFIGSLITLFVIAFSIIIYIFILNSSVESFDDRITKIVDFAKEEHWAECETALSEFEIHWEKSKQKYEAFINHSEIDLINEASLKMTNAVDFRDSENVSLAGNLLKMLLSHLYDSELPTFENILRLTKTIHLS